MSKGHVVIIGAGIGGLASANLLSKAGYKVSVYEKNDQPGGRVGILQRDGFQFDTGPSWYLMPAVFEHYFSLFGKDVNKELDLVKLSPAYKVFYEHEDPITITSDSDHDAATFESIEKGAGEKLRKYVAKGDEIYKLSLQHFLYTNFTSIKDFTKSDIIRRGALMSKLAFTPIDTYVTKFVHDRRLRQILEYPMVFLGSSPFSAPAIYSLMSALDFREGVYYPKGGIYTIIQRLVEIGSELGVDYHYNAATKAIVTNMQKVTGVKLDDNTLIDADIVISNADLHYTETQLLEQNDQSYPTKYWDNKEPGPSALLMYLGIKGKLPTLEHHNLFFVDDWKQNFDDIYVNKKLPKPASIYVCKPSATDATVAPRGHENVFVLVPLPPSMTISKGELENAAEEYIAQLATMAGIDDLGNRIVSRQLFGPNDFRTKFHAWQGTALGASHILRQSAMFRTPNKSKKVKNLYYVGGSTTPGIGLPMCLISAELVYKRLAGDKYGGPIRSIRSIGKWDSI